MPNATCSVDGCEKPTKRLGLCYGHYMKQWRYGTPEPTFEPRWEDLRGRRFGQLVVTHREGMVWVCRCDCGRPHRVRAGDLNRGTTRSCGTQGGHGRQETAGYGAAHERVRRDRGPAQHHACVGCGEPARHWSYNHDDPDELISDEPRIEGVAYSLKPEHYSPRCVPCHKRFDLDRIDAAKVG